ncbi:MAG: hypothetical protein WD768_20300 [Phycisphaeraceae bacterium]
MNTLTILILIAGLLHFGVLIASALVPQVLDWRSELARVSPLTRQLVWTHGLFIVLTIIAFGILSIVNASTLASGDFLARSLCGFIAIFWGARLALQYTWFDARPYLTTPVLRLGYHGLTFVFAYFSAVYGWAALRPAI